MRRNCIPEPSLRVLYNKNWPNSLILRNIDSGEQNKFNLSNGHLICKSFNSQHAKTPVVYISAWTFILRTDAGKCVYTVYTIQMERWGSAFCKPCECRSYLMVISTHARQLALGHAQTQCISIKSLCYTYFLSARMADLGKEIQGLTFINVNQYLILIFRK